MTTAMITVTAAEVPAIVILDLEVITVVDQALPTEVLATDRAEIMFGIIGQKMKAAIKSMAAVFITIMITEMCMMKVEIIREMTGIG